MHPSDPLQPWLQKTNLLDSIDKVLNDLSISSENFRSLYPFRSKSRDDSTLLSHRSPKIIGVEESWEFRVNVHNVNIAFCGVSDNSFIVLTRYWVCFYIDAESAVNFEFQTRKVLASIKKRYNIWSKRDAQAAKGKTINSHCSIFL